MGEGFMATDGEDSSFFWAGLRRGVLLLQRCSSCQRVRFPPLPRCPYCGERASEEVAATGHGTVYSWVVTHHVLHPSMEQNVPYVVATIELAEGARLNARLVAVDASRIHPGMPVTADLTNSGDFPYPTFRPADGPAIEMNDRVGNIVPT